ncbi:MAG: hypothetical protein A3E37_03220 [Candidatus Andersenbacteria bacterium RIFCSPHIGHO2_12_FULL_46_9]|nr:MAG: hypothetical protein UW94_C0003G0037 [Parcubacteria group bacterium GW2011_GWA2_45_14]OGY33806.1 MAG: hypothetical protein A3B76_03005 [Candidatus Andersenbacteria bacterium RIFCSPHIGHO2_02_FULL_46_16]OGY36241.1 MAG: hypothetical protein A3I08_05325 [Candidatus Andersenbacteria bacterium RIFCSPLOWO2_02_FULL_46_11]OGY36674.1 MAG: hypothetical protein A3E37_03220 [Candidatus Andersenbacteria bacterium RIFCSPHIGHO2_12_FULL_46_9]HBE89894.1 hypothetical protein [Candidatus Andersenbacteria b
MKKEIIFVIIRYLLSVVILIVVIGSGWLMATKYEEYKIIDILAYRDPGFALKIYAQFNVSQEFVINERTPVTRLIIPMFIPQEAGAVEISLRQEGNVLEQWRLSEYHEAGKNEGIYEIALPLDSETAWEGKYVLTMDGREISSNEQGKAPRIFIEKDDGRYPAGNYWIASNKKNGDISMQVFGRRQKWQRYKQGAIENPTRAIITGMAYLLAVVIIAAAPHALWRQKEGSGQGES